MKDEDSGSVRAELARVFPLIPAPLITAFTGAALPNSRPPLGGSSPLTQLLSVSIFLFIGVISGHLLLRHSPVMPAFPPDIGSVIRWLASWALWTLVFFYTLCCIVGAARRALDTCHACVHERFSGWGKLDIAIAQFISTVFMLQDRDGYQRDHVALHHSVALATMDDPDLIALCGLGLGPGMTKAELWSHLWKTAISPFFHVRMMLGRIRNNFIEPRLYRRAMAIVWSALLLSFVGANGIWAEFFALWVLPVFVLYNDSALLQFTTEHVWLLAREADCPAKRHLTRLTKGRMVGEAPPARQSLANWVGWWSRLILIHVPTRLAVIVGALPAHDWHHRHPGSTRWANGIYERQVDQDAGCPGWPCGYMSIWGLPQALDDFFEHYSQLPGSSRPDQPLARTGAQVV